VRGGRDGCVAREVRIAVPSSPAPRMRMEGGWDMVGEVEGRCGECGDARGKAMQRLIGEKAMERGVGARRTTWWSFMTLC